MKLIWEIDIPAELNRDREVALGDHRIWASLGPLDFPCEVVVSREAKRLQMEFHYSRQPIEKTHTRADGDLRITIGRRSGRVFYLECRGEPDLEALAGPLQVLKADALGLEEVRCPQRLSAHYAAIAEDVLPFVIEEVKYELMRESR